MAGVEPYAPCPCGSGEKYKWCCQKVEPFADRAQRLFDTGQVEAGIKVLDEGLRKEKGNAWLLTRKAVMQIRSGLPEPAKATLRQLLEKTPKHLGALILLTRCVLETEGAVNGAGIFQQALGSVPEEKRSSLAVLARVVAHFLTVTALFPAAIKHLELVLALGDADGSAAAALRNIDGSSRLAPEYKDRYDLAARPDGLSHDARARFDEALELAAQGLWASAAGLFDHLSQGDPGGAAHFNLGLCRLWLGDEAGAVVPLGCRAIALGDSIEAVDLESLCQMLEPIHPEDKVEHIQLIWPLRNRAALLDRLESAKDSFDLGTLPIDPQQEDPSKGPQAQVFALLDRPSVDYSPGRTLTIDDIPIVLGRVLIEETTVALQAYDDGRIDSLGDRFTALAGASIAAAHPRTKVLGEEARSVLSQSWEWLLPPDMPGQDAAKLNDEKRAQLITQVWVNTPMPYLDFRTPTQAAKAGDAVVPLRAAVRQFDREAPPTAPKADPFGIRAQLNLAPEPEIDPETVDVDRLAVSRLSLVAADRLDDVRLIKLYHRARRMRSTAALANAARAIVNRAALFDRRAVDPVSVYSDLSSLASAEGDFTTAETWLSKGRQADPPAVRAHNASLWDMLEIRLKSRFLVPEAWVPELAIILERYSRDAESNRVVLLNLVEMGLINLVPNPDNPDDMLVDSRPLQLVMAEYGPKVTTASGKLGLSATRPEVWTPAGSGAGSSGGIWTPGGSTEPAGEKPKLILPGR